MTTATATKSATSTPTVQAQTIRETADANNVRLTVRGDIVTVSATFTPGDRAAFIVAEMACNAVLATVRQTRSGSVWGTDSNSVGGFIGMSAGRVTLNKSGADKRVVKILAK